MNNNIDNKFTYLFLMLQSKIKNSILIPSILKYNFYHFLFFYLLYLYLKFYFFWLFSYFFYYPFCFYYFLILKIFLLLRIQIQLYFFVNFFFYVLIIIRKGWAFPLLVIWYFLLFIDVIILIISSIRFFKDFE